MARPDTSEIQKAVYDRLNDNIALLQAEVRNGNTLEVFDDVNPNPEQNQIFPYVTVSDDSHNDWDDKTSDGWDSTIVTVTYSRYQGKLEAKKIDAAISTLLHHTTALTIAGANSYDIYHESSVSGRDPDGKTVQTISRYRLRSYT